MHIGTVGKPKGKKFFISLTIITLLVIGFLLIPTPTKKESSNVKGKTWGDIIMKKFFQDDTLSQTLTPPTQKKWRLQWESLNGKSGSYKATIKQLDDTLVLWQYDSQRRGNYASYIGEKVTPSKYCGTWVQTKPRRKTGDFCLKFVNNFTAANGWTRDHALYSRKTPSKESLWIDTVQ